MKTRQQLYTLMVLCLRALVCLFSSLLDALSRS